MELLNRVTKDPAVHEAHELLEALYHEVDKRLDVDTCRIDVRDLTTEEYNRVASHYLNTDWLIDGQTVYDFADLMVDELRGAPVPPELYLKAVRRWMNETLRSLEDTVQTALDDAADLLASEVLGPKQFEGFGRGE
jgi:hypothetical protein